MLIDFLAYSCINCIRTTPYVKQLYETYKDKGLMVGVHSSELDVEKHLVNVRDAVRRLGITYPVAMDSSDCHGIHLFDDRFMA